MMIQEFFNDGSADMLSSWLPFGPVVVSRAIALAGPSVDMSVRRVVVFLVETPIIKVEVLSRVVISQCI